MLSDLFHRFVKASPVTVMIRGLLERLLNPEQLDAWFARTAEKQYTRELLFSTVVELLLQVVCGVRKSVHVAYQAAEPELAVSVQSVYNKLNGLEPGISAALVRYAGREAAALIEELGGERAALLPGYRVKILDGNCLAASEHRLKELRQLNGGALPGKSLVVYDPALGVASEVFPCEDGHAQERSLLARVLRSVSAGEAWIADRNFCVRGFLLGIAARQAFFVVREHEQLPWQPLGALREVGQTETGTVAEQAIEVFDDAGKAHPWRRIQVTLKQPTRDGDQTIAILTNLPATVDACTIAELYRKRWRIGVSGEGHIVQPVKVRPRLTDSSLVAWEVPWRESKTVKPSDKVHRGCIATHQVVTCSERSSSLVTRIPVAETVDNARKQQGPAEMSPIRRSSPAGYQRRHDAKDYGSTGEAPGTRRRKPAEEPIPITVSGKWGGRYRGGGSGRSTDERRAAKRARREGPGPVGILFGQSEVEVR